MKAVRGFLPTALAALALAGCAPQRQPVIPRAAWVERTDHRRASEGRDTTFAQLTWPEFVGARTPEALDSLRATVDAMRLAPAGSLREPAADTATLLDAFIAEWNETRRNTGSRAYWRLDRKVEVLAETLGVVSLAVSEYRDTGGAHGITTVRYVNVDADRGTTLRFTDLFREELRDSLSAAVEPLFRAARGLAPDSSLRAAGFTFPDGRFRLNDNVAVTRDGYRWHFDPYEIASYAMGPTDVTVPFDRAAGFRAARKR